MSVNDLSRAIAMKALAADVAARLKLGEKPNAIRAELLAEGYPPEVVDHVFSVCENARPKGRRRTVIAATLSALLFLALPVAGAVGGAWAAVALAKPAAEPRPDPDPDALVREARRDNFEPMGEFAKSTAAGLVGLLVGAGIGVALAFAAANTLSAWSAEGSLNDDAIDE
jgi:hypothetical protein